MQNSRVIVRIVVLALLLYAMSGLLSSQRQLRQTQALCEELRQERGRLEERCRNWEDRLSAVGTPGQMEQLARQRLGMVRPGEIVFYFDEPTNREGQTWGWRSEQYWKEG